MTNPTPEQAVPPPEKNDDGGGGGGPLSGIITWIGDSYNGLYKIVLAPSMPTWSTVLLSIFMVLVGMIWAWGISPTTFVGANPNRLNQASQDQWIQMVAVGYTEGVQYTPENVVTLLNSIDNPLGNIQRLAQEKAGTPDGDALQILLAAVQNDPNLAGTASPTQPGIIGNLLAWLIPVIIVLLVVPIFLLLWRLLIYPNIVAGLIDQARQMRDPAYAEQRKREEEARLVAIQQRKAKENMQVEADATLGEPVMKTLSIYSSGRDYDDSFEIELPLDQGGDFLGQCGATIAEAVAPDPVAIEMWLFDMFTQQDKKAVFITEAGYNDPAIRGRIESGLENPSDLIVARDGEKLIVDSDKLRLQGEMKGLQVDANGRFAGFQMPIAAWRKDTPAPATTPTPSAGSLLGAAPIPPTPAGAPDMSTYDDIQFDPPPQPPGGRSMSDYDDIQFDPPPQPPGGRSMSDYDNIQLDPPPTMPSQNPLQPPPLQPPPSGGMQPLTPPPLRNNPPEDDPFGGTGDFTPLNND